jgi:hypothetical protein
MLRSNPSAASMAAPQRKRLLAGVAFFSAGSPNAKNLRGAGTESPRENLGVRTVRKNRGQYRIEFFKDFRSLRARSINELLTDRAYHSKYIKVDKGCHFSTPCPTFDLRFSRACPTFRGSFS